MILSPLLGDLGTQCSAVSGFMVYCVEGVSVAAGGYILGGAPTQ